MTEGAKMLISKVLGISVYNNIKDKILVCPVCGYNNQHFSGIAPSCFIKGNDNYEAPWWGRGDLLIIQFWSECGSRWELCFGFHKGEIFSFVKIIELCGNEFN